MFAGDGNDGLLQVAAHGLADQQALALARQQDGNAAQNHSDQNRCDPVEYGPMQAGCHISTDGCDQNTDQRGTILKQHHESRRIFAAAKRFIQPLFAARLHSAELPECNEPGPAFEHECQCQHEIADHWMFDDPALTDLQYALQDRDA